MHLRMFKKLIQFLDPFNENSEDFGTVDFDGRPIGILIGYDRHVAFEFHSDFVSRNGLHFGMLACLHVDCKDFLHEALKLVVMALAFLNTSVDEVTNVLPVVIGQCVTFNIVVGEVSVRVK